MGDAPRAAAHGHRHRHRRNGKVSAPSPGQGCQTGYGRPDAPPALPSTAFHPADPRAYAHPPERHRGASARRDRTAAARTPRPCPWDKVLLTGARCVPLSGSRTEPRAGPSAGCEVLSRRSRCAPWSRSRAEPRRSSCGRRHSGAILDPLPPLHADAGIPTVARTFLTYGSDDWSTLGQARLRRHAAACPDGRPGEWGRITRQAAARGRRIAPRARAAWDKTRGCA
jgi:hypothetical protein